MELILHTKKYEICITMDADGTHDPKKIDKMIKIIKNKKIDIFNKNKLKDIFSMED